MRRRIFQLAKALSLNYLFQRTKKNRLLVLAFHKISDRRTCFYPSMPISVFREVCTFINKHYEVIHVAEVKEHFKNSENPAAIITFDDSHYEIREYALPILSMLGMKFNVNIDTEAIETSKPQDFVRVYDILNQVDADEYFNPSFMSSPIYIDRSNPNNTEKEFTEILTGLGADQRREFTTDMMSTLANYEVNFSRILGREDIKFLSENSAEIGSHGHTHSILTNISLEEVKDELTKSKNILEEITSTKVNTLAFPNGVSNFAVINLAKKIGYEHFLKTDEEINKLVTPEFETSYFRINQYHQSFGESLAHIYGLTKAIKKLL